MNLHNDTIKEFEEKYVQKVKTWKDNPEGWAVNYVKGSADDILAFMSEKMIDRRTLVKEVEKEIDKPRYGISERVAIETALQDLLSLLKDNK